MTSSRRTSRTTFADALLWGITSLLILGWTPPGAISGDAMAHSENYATGRWLINPNHVLFEPVGAGWQLLLTELGVPRIAPDLLVLLSVLCGAFSVSLFRLGFGREVSRRSSANIGTAWFAASSAFLRMWISGEHFMLEMPFLVMGAFSALSAARSLSLPQAFAAGAWIGTASLFMISHLLLAAATGTALALHAVWSGASRRSLSLLLTCGIGAAIPSFGGLLAVWWIVASGDTSFREWLTTYRGGAEEVRESLAYGLGASGASLRVAVSRSLYGTASSLVDLAPPLHAWRDYRRIGATSILAVIACGSGVLLLGYGLLQRVLARDSATVLLGFGWLTATLLFGVLWDNSDDQFYFHLSVWYGAFAGFAWDSTAKRSLRPLVGATLVLCPLYNTADVWGRFISFPRSRHVSALHEITEGASLVVFPGLGDLDVLLGLTPNLTRERMVSIFSLADRMPQEEGLRELEQRIVATLAQRGCVIVLDILDTPPEVHPWKTLSRLGYEKSRVIELLSRYSPSETQRTLAYVVADIRASDGSKGYRGCSE
jgi:hypothetical protein